MFRFFFEKGLLFIQKHGILNKLKSIEDPGTNF